MDIPTRTPTTRSLKIADLRPQLSRVRDSANDVAASATDKIKDGTGKAREGAGELIQTSRDKASEAYGDARDRTQKIATRANQIVQEHPVVAVAGAVAAGALVAWMFPKSRAAMKALPGIASAAGARVVEAALAARSAATDGAESIKQSASDLAATARKTAASSDLPGKATHITEDVVALVNAKVDALADAIKARLPKN